MAPCMCKYVACSGRFFLLKEMCSHLLHFNLADLVSDRDPIVCTLESSERGQTLFTSIIMLPRGASAGVCLCKNNEIK